MDRRVSLTIRYHSNLLPFNRRHKLHRALLLDKFLYLLDLVACALWQVSDVFVYELRIESLHQDILFLRVPFIVAGKHLQISFVSQSKLWCFVR